MRVEWADEDETDRDKAASDIRVPEHESDGDVSNEEEEATADGEQSCCAVCLSGR